MVNNIYRNLRFPGGVKKSPEFPGSLTNVYLVRIFQVDYELNITWFIVFHYINIMLNLK